MSLVVGEIHDGRISLVGDTKVTFAGDDRSTRHVFENAFPKVLILRDACASGSPGTTQRAWRSRFSQSAKARWTR